MWYAVLMEYGPGSKKLPRVVAHNWNQEEAERMNSVFDKSPAMGNPFGGTGLFLYGYETLHSSQNPQECFECTEIVVLHCRRIANSFQAVLSKRERARISTAMISIKYERDAEIPCIEHAKLFVSNESASKGFPVGQHIIVIPKEIIEGPPQNSEKPGDPAAETQSGN